MGFLKSIIGVKECYKFTWGKKSTDKAGREREEPIFSFVVGESVLHEDPTVLFTLSCVCEKVPRITSPVGWSKSDGTEAPVQ